MSRRADESVYKDIKSPGKGLKEERYVARLSLKQRERAAAGNNEQQVRDGYTKELGLFDLAFKL